MQPQKAPTAAELIDGLPAPAQTQPVQNTGGRLQDILRRAPQVQSRDASTDLIELIKGLPSFDLERGFCMDGTAADRTARDPKLKGVDIGKVCTALIEQSFRTQSDPALLQKRPDQGMYVPFGNIAVDKGFEDSMSNIRVVLGLFEREAKKNPTSQGPIEISLKGGNGKPLVLVSGVAVDAAATRTYQQMQQGVKFDLPTETREAVVAQIKKCQTYLESSNGEIISDTIGNCWNAGEQLMRGLQYGFPLTNTNRQTAAQK